MVDKALVLENRRGILEWKRKMQRTGPQGSNTSSMLVLPHGDLISFQVSRLDSQECKLWVKDFKLPSYRFNAPTSRLLALHSCHHKETVMHIVLVLWDHAIVVVRLGTMVIGVPGSRRIRLHLQAQIKTSIAMLTIVQPLQQGGIKLVLA
jgi:hypothetical protein